MYGEKGLHDTPNLSVYTDERTVLLGSINFCITVLKMIDVDVNDMIPTDTK